jgi:tetratricopeptide (TPR) repeat protein
LSKSIITHQSWWTELRQRWRILHIALIVLAGAAGYSNSLQVRYVLDDYPVISLQGPKDILDILLHGGARRVADATFALNYHLHGLQVVGYHLVNLAIHLTAAITLYFVVVSALEALLSCTDYSTNETVFVERFMPLTVALLFVVHPVQTQSVTYIVQRYTSLATLFYLLSVLCFIKARLAWEKSGTHRNALLLWSASLATGVLAVGSKQIAFTLPFMLIALEQFLFRGRLLNRRFYISCGAVVILALSCALLAWHDRPLQDILSNLHLATSEDHFTSRLTYALTQTRVVATYLRLLCLPFDQSLFYDVPLYTTLFSLPVIISLVLHSSLIMLAALLYRVSGRRLISGEHLQGALQRLAALGIAWFYIAMLVESSIFPIQDVIFEHRIYLPSAGFFLSAAAGTALLVHGRSARVKAAWCLLAVLSLALTALTYVRNQVWSDPLLLWQDTVNKAPGKDLALSNLAGEYMKRYKPEMALPLFVRALELNPDYLTSTKVHLGMALKWFTIDKARFTTGEEVLDIRGLKGRTDLGIEDETRLQYIMYNNLGLANECLGKPLKAKEHYLSALKINPGYDLAWYNLGLLSNQMGDKGLAVSALLQLKKLNPALAELLAKALIR